MASSGKAAEPKTSSSADAPLHMTVSHKDERKKQRAQRIEQRFANEAKEKGLARGGDGRGQNDTRSQSQQQVADSLAHLDKKKQMGIEEVTAIRTEADYRENRRRIKDDAQAQERLQMLQEEAISSGKQNAAIEMRWAELLELNMPQQLYSEIESQKKSCAEIITSKDNLIREFKKQLKVKDEEYVKSLKRYGEDVEELLKRMRKEIRELQQHYEVEMDAIETAFLMERDEGLKNNRGEIEGLLEKRRQKELSYMKQKQDREEEYQKEIEDLLVQEAEEYNKLKIKLETEIQINEQQLEEMRATYQLNTEKLEYNYRVLTERDMENTATLSHQKKKLSKLKDSLSTLMTRFHEQDARDRRRNDDLTDEYRRITKQYKDLQAKFRHFEMSDNQRFEKVWAMHEEEIKKAVDKVLTADDIIHKQIFGWEWRAPKLDLIYNPEVAAAAASSLDPLATEEDLTPEEPEEGVIDTAKVRSMLELLAAEAGFLVDPKVKEALASLPEEEASMAQAESLLKALNVTDESALANLVQYFLKDVPTDEDDEDEEEEEDRAHTLDDMPDEVKQLQMVIQPDDVILAIQRFVDDRKEGGSGGGADDRGVRSKAGRKGAAQGTAGGGNNRNTSLAVHEKEFWARMSSVLPEQHHQAWLRLETELQNYNKLLTDRSRCLDSISKLQQENANLKQLLNVYLSDAVNEDLLIPPTQTFRLEAPPPVPPTS